VSDQPVRRLNDVPRGTVILDQARNVRRVVILKPADELDVRAAEPVNALVVVPTARMDSLRSPSLIVRPAMRLIISY